MTNHIKTVIKSDTFITKAARTPQQPNASKHLMC